MLLTADRPSVKSPYFDPVALRHELTALFRVHGNDAMAARPAILERLKRLLKDAHATAQAELEADGNGAHCAEGLSLFQDELVHLAYDYTKAHVYRSDNPSDAERMAVIATGGYGRGRLAPGSDIDLLFLLPYKQTPWSESVVEYILYLLWDLGQKVGHATRNVEQCVRLSQSDITIRTAILDARMILGDRPLFDNLTTRFAADVVKGSAREFIAAKLAERDERHRRTGEVALSRGAQHQGRQGRLAGSPHPAVACQVYGARDPARPPTRYSRRPSNRRSVGARIFSGRCDAICIFSPAGPKRD